MACVSLLRLRLAYTLTNRVFNHYQRIAPLIAEEEALETALREPPLFGHDSKASQTDYADEGAPRQATSKTPAEPDPSITATEPDPTLTHELTAETSERVWGGHAYVQREAN